MSNVSLSEILERNAYNNELITIFLQFSFQVFMLLGNLIFYDYGTTKVVWVSDMIFVK